MVKSGEESAQLFTAINVSHTKAYIMNVKSVFESSFLCTGCLKDKNKVHFTSCLARELSCISVVYGRRKVKIIKLN